MVGQAVQVAVAKGKPLGELTLAELNGQENGIITEDVYEVLSLQGSVAARNHFGGTAPEQVREAIARAMKRLES